MSITRQCASYAPPCQDCLVPQQDAPRTPDSAPDGQNSTVYREVQELHVLLQQAQQIAQEAPTAEPLCLR